MPASIFADALRPAETVGHRQTFKVRHVSVRAHDVESGVAALLKEALDALESLLEIQRAGSAAMT